MTGDTAAVGLVLLDKPEGYTSFKAAAVLRRIYGTKRVGHTGTLDPMATGALPVLIGRATRLCSFVTLSDKEYVADIRLGITTDTLDITGRVLAECVPDVSDERLLDAAAHFKGEYDQIPPMFSAISKNGVRMYELARQGIEVEREPRRVNIKESEIIDRSGNDFKLRVLCSKGTYIRSLADDIGRYLGCGAVMTGLRRTRTAGFSAADCSSVAQIESDPKAHLLPPETVVRHLKPVEVSEAQAVRFLNGAGLDAGRIKSADIYADGELLRVRCGDRFLGLAKYSDETCELSVKCVIDAPAARF